MQVTHGYRWLLSEAVYPRSTAASSWQGNVLLRHCVGAGRFALPPAYRSLTTNHYFAVAR